MAKQNGIATIAIAIGVTVFCVLIGIASDHYLGHDNAIEQLAEAEIKQETGIDVDLSP
jgi:hypothetical protein